MKQAQSASRAAESLMDAGDSKKTAEKNSEWEKKGKAAEEGSNFKELLLTRSKNSPDFFFSFCGKEKSLTPVPFRLLDDVDL